MANDRDEEAVPPARAAVGADGPDLEQIDLPAFAYVRRGYDPDQVAAHVALLVEQVASLRAYAGDLEDRERVLQANLAETSRRSDILASRLDAEVTELAARETEQVLVSARALAVETRARAESDAVAVLAATKQRAKAMWIETQRRCQERLAEVEDTLAARQAELADVDAELDEGRAGLAELLEEIDRLEGAAQAEGGEVLESARSEADTLRAEAERIVDAARRTADDILDQARAEAHEVVAEAQADGEDMVEEARELRERLLGDITRRRSTLREQVEQLQAGRDRLLVAYAVVRQTWEDAVVELDLALPEARDAAHAAVERMLARGTDDDAVARALAQRHRPPVGSGDPEGGEDGFEDGYDDGPATVFIEDDDVVGEADIDLDDDPGFLEPTGRAAQAAAASPHAAPLGPGGRNGRTAGRDGRRSGRVPGTDDGEVVIPPVPPRVPARLAPDAVAGRWSSAVRVIPPPSSAPPEDTEVPEDPGAVGIDAGDPALTAGSPEPEAEPPMAPVTAGPPVLAAEPDPEAGPAPELDPEPSDQGSLFEPPAHEAGPGAAAVGDAESEIAATTESAVTTEVDEVDEGVLAVEVVEPAVVPVEATAAAPTSDRAVSMAAIDPPTDDRPVSQSEPEPEPEPEREAASEPGSDQFPAVAAERVPAGALESAGWRPAFLHHPLTDARPGAEPGDANERHPWWMAAPRTPEGGPGSLSTIDLVAALVQGASPAEADDGPSLPVDPVEAARARCDAAVADARRSLRRRLKATLADDQNQVLDALQRVAVGVPAAAEVLVDEPTHRARFVDAARAGLLLAAATGRELAADLALDEARRRYPASPVPLGLGVHVAPPVIAEDLVTWLADELLDMLRTRLLMCFPTETMVSENPRLDRARRDEVQWALRSAYRKVKGAKVDALIDRASTEAVYRSVHDHLPSGLRPGGVPPQELFSTAQ